MIKAVLLDLDGTILDSMKMWETLGVKVLESLGFSTKDDLNEIFKTFTINQAAQYYSDHFPTNLTVPELEELINKTIENAYLNELNLKEGVPKFLNDLNEKEIKIGLVTATDSYLAQKALERLNVLKFFDLILSCDDLKTSKNEPFIYNKALQELGIKQDEVLVFEDAYHALKTAHDNGYLTVGIYDSSNNEEDEIKSIADYYLNNFKGYQKILKF